VSKLLKAFLLALIKDRVLRTIFLLGILFIFIGIVEWLNIKW